MTNYTWTIVQMNRLTADGFVVTVHYNVSATDGTYNASHTALWATQSSPVRLMCPTQT
jgi:hypothetical protein